MSHTKLFFKVTEITLCFHPFSLKTSPHSLDNFLRIAVVDCVDIFSQRGSCVCLDFLDFLQTTTCDEEPSCLGVMWQHLAELSHHVFEDVGWSIV